MKSKRKYKSLVIHLIRPNIKKGRKHESPPLAFHIQEDYSPTNGLVFLSLTGIGKVYLGSDTAIV